MLTVNQRRAYIDNNGATCPFCGSHDLEGSSVDITEGVAHQEVHCVNCDAAWCDIYTLTDISVVSEPTKEEH